jgi:RNA polymerase sigma factor (sigma-70 family)
MEKVEDMTNVENVELDFQRMPGKERELYVKWEYCYARMVSCILPLGFVSDHYLRVLKHLRYRVADTRRFFDMDTETFGLFQKEVGSYYDSIAPLVARLRSLWFDVSNMEELFECFRGGASPLNWHADFREGMYFCPSLKADLGGLKLSGEAVALLKAFCEQHAAVHEYLLVMPLAAEYLEILVEKVYERLEEYLELEAYVGRLIPYTESNRDEYFKDQLFLLNATLQVSRRGFQIFPGDVPVFCGELKRLREAVAHCRETLFLGSRYLVRIQSRRYSGRLRSVGLITESDLFQEGCVGLLGALTRFQYRRGTEFGAYASWFVKQAITDFLASFSGVARLPIHQAKQWHAIRGFKGRFTQEHGRAPTSVEIGEEFGLTTQLVNDLEISAAHAFSLDTPVGEDGDQSLSGLIFGEGASPAEECETSDKYAYLRKLMDELPAKERATLVAYFGMFGEAQLGMKEIAEVENVTCEAVRQRLAGGQQKLRALIEKRPEARELLMEFFRGASSGA